MSSKVRSFVAVVFVYHSRDSLILRNKYPNPVLITQALFGPSFRNTSFQNTSFPNIDFSLPSPFLLFCTESLC